MFFSPELSKKYAQALQAYNMRDLSKFLVTAKSVALDKKLEEVPTFNLRESLEQGQPLVLAESFLYEALQYPQEHRNGENPWKTWFTKEVKPELKNILVSVVSSVIAGEINRGLDYRWQIFYRGLDSAQRLALRDEERVHQLAVRDEYRDHDREVRQEQRLYQARETRINRAYDLQSRKHVWKTVSGTVVPDEKKLLPELRLINSCTDENARVM